MIKSESQRLEEFVIARANLIDLLDKNKLSKLTFNEKNNELFDNLQLKPFSKLDTFNKALFNYNYYNTKAKIALAMCNKYKEQKKINKSKREENLKLNCYSEKDKATYAMVDLEDKEFLEAYYINLNSKNLAKSIFEINFKNREKVILHSKNNDIKDLLIKKGVFIEEIRDSLIDTYVNKG